MYGSSRIGPVKILLLKTETQNVQNRCDRRLHFQQFLQLICVHVFHFNAPHHIWIVVFEVIDRQVELEHIIALISLNEGQPKIFLEKKLVERGCLWIVRNRKFSIVIEWNSEVSGIDADVIFEVFYSINIILLLSLLEFFLGLQAAKIRQIHLGGEIPAVGSIILVITDLDIFMRMSAMRFDLPATSISHCPQLLKSQIKSIAIKMRASCFKKRSLETELAQNIIGCVITVLATIVKSYNNRFWWQNELTRPEEVKFGNRDRAVSFAFEHFHDLPEVDDGGIGIVFFCDDSMIHEYGHGLCRWKLRDINFGYHLRERLIF